MKQITFLGKQYSVPDWAKYITMSCGGVIEVWKYLPLSGGNYWYYDERLDYKSDNHCVLVNELEMSIEEIK